MHLNNSLRKYFAKTTIVLLLIACFSAEVAQCKSMGPSSAQEKEDKHQPRKALLPGLCPEPCTDDFFYKEMLMQKRDSSNNKAFFEDYINEARKASSALKSFSSSSQKSDSKKQRKFQRINRELPKIKAHTPFESKSTEKIEAEFILITAEDLNMIADYADGQNSFTPSLLSPTMLASFTLILFAVALIFATKMAIGKTKKMSSFKYPYKLASLVGENTKLETASINI